MNRVSSKSDVNGLKNVLDNSALESAKSTKKVLKTYRPSIYWKTFKFLFVKLLRLVLKVLFVNAILFRLAECIICTAHIVSNKKTQTKIKINIDPPYGDWGFLASCYVYKTKRNDTKTQMSADLSILVGPLSTKGQVMNKLWRL